MRIDLANYSNTSLNVDLHRNIYFNIHFIFHFNKLWNNTSSQQLSDRHFIHHTLHTFTTLSQHTFQILHHNNWVTDYLTTLIILCRGVNDRCFILFNKLWNISSTILQHIFNSSHYFWKRSSSTNWVTFFHHSLHTSYHNFSELAILIQQTLHHIFTQVLVLRSNLWTILSQQFHHNNFITTYETIYEQYFHSLWIIRQHIFTNFIARFISTNS